MGDRESIEFYYWKFQLNNLNKSQQPCPERLIFTLLFLLLNLFGRLVVTPTVSFISHVVQPYFVVARLLWYPPLFLSNSICHVNVHQMMRMVILKATSLFDGHLYHM
jgi:hypothetical protein